MSSTLEEKIIARICPTVLDQIRDSIYIVDSNGRMFFINKAVERLEGFTNEEVKGKHINELYSQNFSPSLEVIRTRKTITNYENKYFVNGKYFTMDCTTFPLMDGENLLAVVNIHKDITSLKNLVLENISLQNSQYDLKNDSSAFSDPFSEIIGTSPNFIKAVHIAQIASANDASVLLTGPTGSGKEVFAKAIHKNSPRSNKPFLAINCSAIPETLFESILFGTSKGSFTGAENSEGLFEQAQGGTLFLDEINSMSYATQSKLLRALETKEIRRIGGKADIPIDVRIISSSSALPQEALARKQIREDLFYRLDVIDIIIPNLASRGDDIFLLADYFIQHFNEILNKKILSFDKEVKEFFSNYSWSGNVRQLKHCIEYAVTLALPSEQILTLNHLPQYILEDDVKITPGEHVYTRKNDDPDMKNSGSAFNGKEVFIEIEKAEVAKIIHTLMNCNGNVSQCARELNIHRQSLIYKMGKYGITRK